MSSQPSPLALVSDLWPRYAEINPQAARIHDLLKSRGETILNDHIALRTWNFPGMTVDDLAKPFIAAGYQEAGQYVFHEKHLTAKHWQHPNLELPKVFISQLEWRHLSAGIQSIILSHANSFRDLHGEMICNSGRTWSISSTEYEALSRESEYAAWLSAWGFIANHFTVSAHSLKTFQTLRELNDFLMGHKFPLNAAGGLIKGSPSEGLEQSSTLAATALAHFSDGKQSIPGCYYEFAWRYPQANGKLFHGFLEKSADKIFESTHHKSK